MEDNTNQDHISQQNNEMGNLPEPPQVPPSLFPTVLHRLGLTPEQAQQEMSVEEAMVKLKSNDWEERAKAVRFLGKRATVIPLELLEAALEDEDGTVRATAVHAIGNIGKHAPLHRLLQALHDSDWHVRETAVFVLGKHGSGVPNEVFKTVLYDTDPSVREAARYVLQQHIFPIETVTRYGQLQEKKRMQQDSDAIQMNSRDGRSPYEPLPSMVLHANNEYHGYAESSHSLREQSQAYAPQEQVPYEYRADRHYGEKATSLPQHRSSKKWWIIIPIVAIFFFILGAISVGLFSVRSSSQVAIAQPGVGNIAQPQVSGDAMLALFGDAKYQSMLENEVSSGLNLTQEQIHAQLQAGKSMTDIATAQGISTDQLREIETGAFTDTLQAMVKAGDISQSAADSWQTRTLGKPELVDTWTSMIFLLPHSVPGGS
jgi:HEAT repeat